MNIKDIISLNKLNRNQLWLGEIIKIPANNENTPKQKKKAKDKNATFHIVKKSNTLCNFTSIQHSCENFAQTQSQTKRWQSTNRAKN